MKKAELVEKIIDVLKEKVSLHVVAARAAHDEAIHEDSKAEDIYDTRGLEASYLAAGQARQVEEMMEALHEYATMTVRTFAVDEPVDVGALVELELKKERHAYFIGPTSGGLEVEHDGQTVLVLTPQSPLGKQLVGRKKGDKLKIKIAGFVDQYDILSVS